MELEGFPIRIGFIGAGNMATALLDGFIASGLEPGTLAAVDPDPSRREVLEARGVRTLGSREELLAESDVVIIAVKPALVEKVLSGAEGDQLWLSVAAGVPTQRMEAALSNSSPRVIRAMPNTPALVRRGATAIAAGKFASETDLELAEKLLGSVGRVCRVSEGQMDAVTGLSGSGPAYVMLFIEALADGGVRAGLPRKVALELAAQTVMGSAALLLESGQHPGELKDMVTSPGGTTIAGIAALEQAGFRAAALGAVEAATRRAEELSQRS